MVDPNANKNTSLQQPGDGRIAAIVGQLQLSPNVDVEMKARVCAELNIMTEAIPDRYLGLPSMIGLKKSERFEYLVERIINNRLKGWKEKNCLWVVRKSY